MLSKNVKRKVTIVMMVVGGIFSFLSNVGNSWEHITHNGSYQLGLWKVCANSYNFICVSREKTGTLKITQTLMTLGCLGYSLAYIFYVLHINKMFTMKLLGGVLNTSAFCLLIGISLYTNQVSAREYTFGWSYAVGWISVILAFAAGLLCFLETLNPFKLINNY
nr:lens fiber membrane intrinsic protein [Hydra vulgaris]